MRKQKQFLDLCIINIANLVLASAAVFAKLIPLGSFSIILGRSIVALPCVGVCCFLFNAFKKIRSVKHAVLCCLVGIFMGFHWAFFYESIKVSNVAVGVIIIHVYPLITVVLETILYRLTLNKMQVFECCLVILGVFVISFTSLTVGSIYLGIFYGLIAAIFLAVRNILVKELLQYYSPLFLMFFQLFITILMFLPFNVQELWLADSQSLYLILIVGILVSGLGHTMFVMSLRTLSAGTVGIIASSQTLYAPLYAYIVLHESITWFVIFGGLFIVVAVICEQIRSLRN